MNLLILYGSLEGQTKKISDRLAGIIRDKGHQVTAQSGEDLPATFSVDNFDAAILGGSIHMGKYPAYLNSFVASHRDWLNAVPSAFFTVCMAVNSANTKSRDEAKHYGDKLTAQTGWTPKLTQTFAGAVKYTQYNFFTRFIMRWISSREGGSTDTSRDHEYTDWAAVERFAEDFIGVIEQQGNKSG
ncbi:MAG: flavodoxin domain-containing protein [Gammaproteobacteria bacterium]|nr:flavodoxin domain-containing protein [Gammaproteobacteria bacterium]